MTARISRSSARPALSAMIAIVAILLAAVAHAEPQTVRLLTVGNSFADNALSYLPKIVDAAGDKLVFARANLGGCSMERHWSCAEAYEADHLNPAGKPYAGKSSLAELLRKDTWDVVTIQQYSVLSHDVTTYRPYARNLHDYIHKVAPQATILIQQTWAYRIDDPRFSPANKDAKTPHTQQAMYEQVRAAYHTIATELGIGILPSGDALYLVDTDPTWAFHPDTTFDAAKAVRPELPDQTHSMHAGYAWRKQRDGTTKLTMDGHHASPAGRYLIGCVWYEVLFKRSVVDNPFVPEGIAPDFAKFLRETAHRAVTGLQPQ